MGIVRSYTHLIYIHYQIISLDEYALIFIKAKNLTLK